MAAPMPPEAPNTAQRRNGLAVDWNVIFAVLNLDQTPTQMDIRM
jgi:hypothetical protein